METIRTYWGRYRLGYWLAGAVSAVFSISVLVLLSVYLLPSSWGFVRQVRDVFPLPVMIVSGRPVATYADIAEDLSALRNFYESQDFSSVGLRVDFSTPDGADRLRFREREILNKRAEDGVIRKLSEGEGISFTLADALSSVLRQAEAADGVEAAEEKVRSLYGWELGQFAERVVLPDLYRRALEERFEGDADRSFPAEERIRAAKKMLDDGRAFSDVADGLSDGRTAESGGALGWFSSDQLIEPLREAVANQEIGVPGEVVESPLGFHIVLVNGRRTEDGKELSDVSQIFSRKQSFGEWLSERMQDETIRILAPEYVWDATTATVEFRDETLRARERELLERSEGDASVMF